MPMAHDVFISHATPDKPIAVGVCERLEAAEIRCWIAPRDILPGQNWGACIVRAIRESRVLILILSAGANESPQIEREIQLAVHHKVAILPFRIQDVRPSDSLQYFLGAAQWLDAMPPPIERHVDRLVVVVGQLIGRQVNSEGTPASGPSRERAERLEQIDRQLTEFFRPLHARLLRDNISWQRILDLQDQPEESVRWRVADQIERDYLLPNHDEKVAIIERWRYLVEDDGKLCDVLEQYIHHVVVYKALRATGDRKTMPIHVGSPWPQEFFPLIEDRMKRLEKERCELVKEIQSTSEPRS
jgi:hypothetical protein